MYTMYFAYDRPIFLVPLSPSYPSSPVAAEYVMLNEHQNPISFSESANGVVVSFGYNTTHILPVVAGGLDAKSCRRINMGGAHLESFMHRLLQLKYPGHFAAITLSRAEVVDH